MAKTEKERENTPNTTTQQNAEAEAATQAQEIIQMAKSEIASQSNEPDAPMLGGIGDEFKGLPMRELIGGPLIAAAEAQEKLAATAWSFYQRIAFEADEKTGALTKEPRMIKIEVERPVEKGGEMVLLKQKVQAPFIGLVPIPSLLIDNINIDFQMEVTATNTEKSTTAAETSTSIKGGSFWYPVKAEISGKVSTSRENTRTSNQTAKYHVHVTASQQPQTEGLSKLMDIMASCIEPIPVNAKQAE
jgi:hypothetical protein